MKKLLSFLVIVLTAFSVQAQGTAIAPQEPVKTIFAYGGQVNKAFVKYIISLTGKPDPKVCFLPTATGDSPNYIAFWYGLCTDLPMRPYVQKTFINASPEQKSFEAFLLDMDAIVVGGGNTLNMMAIWQAQGIDTILKKAYDRGIVLAGGSAGSLCWFNGGYSDSRPQQLTIVNGLGLIPASHCPHYNSEASRKPLYHKSILDGLQAPGYACDELSGIVFRNGQPVKAVSIDENNHSYYVYLENGDIREQKLDVDLIE